MFFGFGESPLGKTIKKILTLGIVTWKNTSLYHVMYTNLNQDTLNNTRKKMSSTLTLAFVEPCENDHWLNRLTARVCKHPFCHVELYFGTTNQSFSILSGETANLRNKTLANPNYNLLTLAVTDHEYNSCLNYCIAAKSWDLKFDEEGMWGAWLCQPFALCYGRVSWLDRKSTRLNSSH